MIPLTWLGTMAVAWWLYPPTVLPITLVGVSVNARNPVQSIAVIRCPAAGESAMSRPGQRACAMADVVGVRDRAVLVRNVLSNRLELLTFVTSGRAPLAPTAPTAPVAAPVVKKSATGVDVTLSKSAVEHYLVNLPELLTSALATPHMRELPDGTRAMDGFALGEIKPGSVIDQLGLKNGDVIQRVNGEPLDSLAAAIRLAAMAQTRAESTMDVLRAGKVLTFAFRTR